jgi:hypothetical protein
MFQCSGPDPHFLRLPDPDPLVMDPENLCDFFWTFLAGSGSISQRHVYGTLFHRYILAQHGTAFYLIEFFILRIL